jgi:hypothetical protein
LWDSATASAVRRDVELLLPRCGVKPRRLRRSDSRWDRRMRDPLRDEARRFGRPRLRRDGTPMSGTSRNRCVHGAVRLAVAVRTPHVTYLVISVRVFGPNRVVYGTYCAMQKLPILRNNAPELSYGEPVRTSEDEQSRPCSICPQAVTRLEDRRPNNCFSFDARTVYISSQLLLRSRRRRIEYKLYYPVVCARSNFTEPCVHP